MFLGSNIHVGRMGLLTGEASSGGVTYSLDDYTWIMRLEADNARRSYADVENGVYVDGDNAIIFPTGGAPGSGGSHVILRTPSANLNLYNISWTIDGWLYFPTDTFGTSKQYAMFQLVDGSYTFNVSVDSERLYCQISKPGNTYPFALDSGANGGAWKPTAGWHHVAVVHDVTDSEYRLYLDGVSQTPTSAQYDQIADRDGYEFYIGANANYVFSNSDGDGKASRFRITPGELFTSNFTPAARSVELTVTNELIVHNFDGDNLSTRMLDDVAPEDGGLALALPDIDSSLILAKQQLSIKAPTYHEDAGGNYLQFSGVEDVLVGTLSQAQTFTVYMVANVSADTVAQTMFGDANAFFGLTSAEYFSASAGTELSDSTDHSGAKKLFAVEFSGGTGKLYVDGVKVAEGVVGAGSLATFGLGSDAAIRNPTNMKLFSTFAQAEAYNEEANSAIASVYGV